MSLPRELAAGDVYFSPLLLVIVLAIMLAWITVVILNRTRLSRFIAFPSLTFMAITLLYVIGIDRLFLPF
ncbi:DUF1656 domain-containing protein [Shewanella sp. VB17]|uniref:DUF1656 domain-containing protein n=1 Tax=Shewanella sp. VB17 TaxID=2739432 RepID=UPI0015674512|nr:DUF1656 domain-containing protein [Shewanella sp. VB17]NRD74985.1 DUF1656 domain-containing protein [Shewanella sp. VB17]